MVKCDLLYLLYGSFTIQFASYYAKISMYRIMQYTVFHFPFHQARLKDQKGIQCMMPEEGGGKQTG